MTSHKPNPTYVLYYYTAILIVDSTFKRHEANRGAKVFFSEAQGIGAGFPYATRTILIKGSKVNFKTYLIVITT